MDRNRLLLRHVDKDRWGVEVGPSHSPLAPKRDGYKVHVIDHLDRAGLVAKYAAHGIDTAAIEEVDFVWSGQPFAELTGRRHHYQWALASHVVEHAPDLIGFLNDCDALLADDGVLSLAVPDKRFCFDCYRPISGLGAVIDARQRAAASHSPGTLAEYQLNVVSRGGQLAWGPGTPGPVRFVGSLADPARTMREAMTGRCPDDVHAWCFTPHSFRLLVHDLHALGLTPLREVDFVPSTGHEFFVALGRHGAGMSLSRLEALDAIDTELVEGVLAARRPPPARGKPPLLARAVGKVRRLFARR